MSVFTWTMNLLCS